MKLAPCHLAVTGENMNRYYRFLKGFNGPADIPTFFQGIIDRTLGHQTSVWLDDIFVVTRGTNEEHTRKLYSGLTKLENEGYKASKNKSKLHQKNNMAQTHKLTRRNQTQQKKNRRNKQTKTHNQHQNHNIIFGCNSKFRKIYTKSF